jgi:hypothetical protein
MNKHKLSKNLNCNHRLPVDLLCSWSKKKTHQHLGICIMFYAWPGMDDGVSQIEENKPNKNGQSVAIATAAAVAAETDIEHHSTTGFGDGQVII